METQPKPSVVDYDPESFRPYTSILREFEAVLEDDYAGTYGVELPRKTAADLQWTHLLARLASYCVSDRAAAIAESLPLLQHKASVERRLREIEEAVRLQTEDDPMPLRGLVSVHRAVSLARRGAVLDGESLLGISKFSRACSALSRYFSSRVHLAPLLAQVAATVEATPQISQTLER